MSLTRPQEKRAAAAAAASTSSNGACVLPCAIGHERAADRLLRRAISASHPRLCCAAAARFDDVKRRPLALVLLCRFYELGGKALRAHIKRLLNSSRVLHANLETAEMTSAFCHSTRRIRLAITFCVIPMLS